MEIFAMALGQCYNDATVADADADSVSDIRLIDCDRPHRYEVYHIHRVPDEKFPGSQAVSDMADDICEAHFADYVGIAYDDSSFFFSSYTPTRESWRRKNDRDIVCVIELDDESMLTGSIRGSGR